MSSKKDRETNLCNQHSALEYSISAMQRQIDDMQRQIEKLTEALVGEDGTGLRSGVVYTLQSLKCDITKQLNAIQQDIGIKDSWLDFWRPVVSGGATAAVIAIAAYVIEHLKG